MIILSYYFCNFSYLFIILVPVTNIILSVTDESSSLMKEYSMQTIKCTTSFSRPQPQVRWYLQQFNKSMKKNITGNSSTQTFPSNTVGELVAAESTLKFYPNRTFNKWLLYCEGWTENITRAVPSNKLTLNVTCKFLQIFIIQILFNTGISKFKK